MVAAVVTSEGMQLQPFLSHELLFVLLGRLMEIVSQGLKNLEVNDQEEHQPETGYRFWRSSSPSHGKQEIGELIVNT